MIYTLWLYYDFSLYSSGMTETSSHVSDMKWQGKLCCLYTNYLVACLLQRWLETLERSFYRHINWKMKTLPLPNKMSLISFVKFLF